MKKDLKKMIKSAATEIYLNKGYQAVSMRKIAQKIGCSATAIYLYYQNKEALLNELTSDYNASYAAKIDAVLASDQTAVQKLQTLLTAYVEQALQQPEMFKLLNSHFKQIKSGKAEMRENQNFAVLRNLAQQCLDQQIFIEAEADKIAQVLWMHVYGVAALMVNKPQLAWGNRLELANFAITQSLDSFRSK